MITRHYINGKETIPFKEWESVEWELDFQADSIQGEASISNVVLTHENYKTAYDHVFKNGKAFIGLDYSIALGDFKIDGYLHNFEFDTSNEEATASFTKKNDVYTILQEMSRTTCTQLKNEGYKVGFDKVSYVVIAVDNEGQLLMLILATTFLGFQIKEQTFKTVEVTQKQIRAIQSLAPPNFEFFSLVEAIVVLSAQIALFVALIVQATKMISQIVEILLPAVRYHYASTFRQLLQPFCDKYSLVIQTNIPELDYYYLPSNVYGGEIKDSLPKSGDYGHILIDLLDLLKSISGAKVTFLNKNLYIYNENDPFWVKNSTYVLNSTNQMKKFKTNSQDFEATIFTKFKTDAGNEWTFENFAGTNNINITELTNIKAGEVSLLYRYKERQIQASLISTHDNLTIVEETLKGLLKIGDNFLSALGGKPKFIKLIKNRLNAIKFSNDYHYENYVFPKDIKNSRKILNAKIVSDNNSKENYIKNNYIGQKLKFEGIEIPMTYYEFILVAQNSTFRLDDGRIGKFNKIKYNDDLNLAIADFEVNEIFTKDLKLTSYNG